jgi:hypothetical protein
MCGQFGGLILSLFRTCSILAVRLGRVPFEKIPGAGFTWVVVGVRELPRNGLCPPNGDELDIAFAEEVIPLGFGAKALKEELFCESKGDEVLVAALAVDGFVVGFGAKGLKGDAFCDPNGDETGVGFATEGFAVVFGANGLKGGVFSDPEGSGFVVVFGAKGFVVGFAAKGLYGGAICDPNGEALDIAFGAKGFAVPDDPATAKRSGLGSSGGSAKRTDLFVCPPPLEAPLPLRPLTIVPF